jgi:SAM-dependent MidA family methyltransferase
MKQTAVEWLCREIWQQTGFLLPNNILEQAKKMELEQMHEAYMAGAKDVQELIQKQAIEEIDRLNSEG